MMNLNMILIYTDGSEDTSEVIGGPESDTEISNAEENFSD